MSCMEACGLTLLESAIMTQFGTKTVSKKATEPRTSRSKPLRSYAVTMHRYAESPNRDCSISVAHRVARQKLPDPAVSYMTSSCVADRDLIQNQSISCHSDADVHMVTVGVVQLASLMFGRADSMPCLLQTTRKCAEYLRQALQDGKSSPGIVIAAL